MCGGRVTKYILSLYQPEIESRASAWRALMLPLHRWYLNFDEIEAKTQTHIHTHIYTYVTPITTPTYNSQMRLLTLV